MPDITRQVVAAAVRALSRPEERAAAGFVERVVSDASRVHAAFPPQARAAMRAGAVLVEFGGGRRRFSRLERAEATASIDRWERRPLAVRRLAQLPIRLALLAYFEQPEVRDRLGYRPDGWIAEIAERRRGLWHADVDAHQRLLVSPAPLRASVGGPQARAAGAIREGHTLPAAGLDVDVVVVGSGAGGAVVAAELAEAGLSVAVLEEGEHYRTEDFTTSTLDALRLMYRDAGASVALGRAPIQYSEGRCVGGSTTINGAMAFRAHERVLAEWTERSGISDLIGELDPHYGRVERFLSVRPQDPDAGGRDQELLLAGARKLGWRTVQDDRAQVHCMGCNVCTWGCPTGAKQSTLVSYLPRALTFGADVWSGCRVSRVIFDGKRAVGVRASVTDDSGVREVEVRARRVVVSAGAIQTPFLLARSGLRTPSGRLGHGLTLHPGAAITAVFDERVDGWKGAHQTHQVREFEPDGIVLAAVNVPPAIVGWSLPIPLTDIPGVMDGYPTMVTSGMLVEDTGSGRVRAVGDHAVATYRLTDRDAAAVQRATGLLGELLFAAGARTLYLPVDGVGAVGDMDGLRRALHDPVAAERMTLTTVHLMGTAAMGVDASRSVCDAFGAVHDTAGLFVADASLFPGPVGINPQLTIMALATRAAARIIDTW
jgi:choline dehydrogenase-like flavoprotein